MPTNARTFILDGLSARSVRVEVDIHRGLPSLAIIGLPDAAVREARKRVRAALVNCGFEFPLWRIVVNIAPASVRRVAPELDLAIAVALLCASDQLEWEGLEEVALAGELALDGTTRPVQGALAMAEAARDAGSTAIVIPQENGSETALVQGIDVIPLAALSQLPALAAGEWKPPRPDPLPLHPADACGSPDLADLRGQTHLRRGLEVAAAGGHSLLMVGPPGAGKALAASRLPSILPPLAPDETLEVARIASAYGRLGAWRGCRPFRAPHRTISCTGLVGTGTPPRAGEATLAHRGVLFLDEVDEFQRDGLEALQAALQAGGISISRGRNRLRFPSRFLLVAAAKPCPCGRGESDPLCSCAPLVIERHRAMLRFALDQGSGILAEVQAPTPAEVAGSVGESSAEVRKRVCAARERQERRLGAGRCNAEMTPAEARSCALTAEAGLLLADLYARQRLNGNAHDRALRLAQTLTDLAGVTEIGEEQLEQALAIGAMHCTAAQHGQGGIGR